MDIIGGRKFIFALFVVIIAGVFVVTGKLSAVEWNSFAVLIGGMYIGGNLGDQFIASKTPPENKEEPPKG